MPRKTKRPKLHTVTKKLTSRGYYFYETKTKKRISKESYYRRLKRHQSKIISRRSKLQKKKIRASKIKKERVNTTFAHGFNFSKKVRIFFEASNVEFIVKVIDSFFLEVKKRFKSLKELMYIELSGLLYADDEIDLVRTTRISFVQEYSKESFRKEEIRRTVEKIYELIGQQFYEYGEVTDFQLKQISINQRN